jgi:hypothetical protein
MNNDDPILDAMPPGKEESNKSFLSGVLYALVFYAAGFSLAGISYLIISHPYIHAPGMHHLILLGTFAGGLGWIIGAGIKALKGLRSSRLRGILLTNAVVILGFLGFLYNMSRPDHETVHEEGVELNMTHHGDTAIISDGDNIIYMRVGDSVLMNLFDSAKVEEKR